MIYIRGDTHGNLAYFTDMFMPGQSAWTAEDKLIVTGDFGFVFLGEKENEEEYWKLETLSEKPYEILFVDGNHEGFDKLETYPEEIRYGGPVRRLRNNVFWLRRGHIYTIEGKTFFVMGGGCSTDKAWRVAHEQSHGQRIWFPQEMPSSEEYHRAAASLQAHHMQVDYILTHTAPRVIIPQVIRKYPNSHEAELNGFLDWVYYEVDFKKWFFGHLHEDLVVNDLMVACYETVHALE